MLLELKDHQKKTIEYAIENPYSILALDMGTGKTACALGIHERLGGKTLVVVPSFLSFTWLSEIKKFLGDKVVVSSFKSGKEIYPLWDTDICIVSYDLGQKAPQLFRWADRVIFDEAHLLKTMESKRTTFYHRAIYESAIKRVHLLTGTPIKNRVEEYYSLISICNYDPRVKSSDFLERFPESVSFADYFSFREEFNIEKWSGGRLKFIRVLKWSGVRNTEELKTYLKGHYIRFDSKDILDLPDILFKDVFLSKEDNEELIEAFSAFEDNKRVNPNAKSRAAMAKVPLTIKYVEGILNEIDQVIIYTDHVDSCEALSKHFKTLGITGSVPVQARNRLSEEFKSGKRRVLVATIGSFSTGVTLTNTNHMVFNDYSWVPGDMKQAIYRIHRLGQTKQCVVHRILGSPQDEYILKAIDKKIETIKEVVT